MILQQVIMENKLLSANLKKRNPLVQIFISFQCVIINKEVAVGRTDFWKVRILLEEGVVPVRDTVREIEPYLQNSLKEQIDSWLRDSFFAWAMKPYGSPSGPCG